jgi:hypothetical protein
LSSTVPDDPPVYRLIHVDNLDTLLRRGGLHAPNFVPADGLPYRSIHRLDVQGSRMSKPVPVGPRGVLLDYVPFYLGPRAPMLYQLHTGWVGGYDEGQHPLVYLVSSPRAVEASGAGWAFTDGHALAGFTMWYDDLENLAELDWDAILARAWMDTAEHPDRKRRKQADFLVHRFCDWNLITGIGVFSSGMKAQVEDILARHPNDLHRKVAVVKQWYY